MVPDRSHETDGSSPEELSKAGGAGATAPAFMYIHFLTEEEHPYYPVYLFQISDHNKLEVEIEDAVGKIDLGDAHQIKAGPNGVEWRVYSYAVFVLKHKKSAITGVEFCYNNKKHDKAFSKVKEMSRFGNLFTAVYYQNNRKNEHGNDLGPNGREVLTWEVSHSHPIPRQGGGIVNHTSTDPNTGP